MPANARSRPSHSGGRNRCRAALLPALCMLAGMCLCVAPAVAQQKAAAPAAPNATAGRPAPLVPGEVPPGAVPGCTGKRGEVRLRVTVHDVRTSQGLMTITLYPDDPAKFLTRTGKIARLRVPVTAPETEACMVAPGPGNYAIAVYHDVNANRDFDRNFIGLPREPFGFSNNVRITTGLPRFHEVRFSAKAGDTPVDIMLHH